MTTADELTAAVTEKTVSTIKLGADINVTSTIGIRRTVNLDLNDHVLRMTGDGNVIEVGNGGDLTLVDDAQTKTPKYFDRGDNGLWTLRTDDTETEYTITGGVITGGKSKTAAGYRTGGGVDVYGSTFTMTDGNIVGCTAMAGGGVYLSNNSFTMTGGSIVDCTADDSRSEALYLGDRVNSTISISGGEFHGTVTSDGTVSGGEFHDMVTNHGTIADSAYVTVTITVKPDEGYEIDKVTVTDSKGNSITVTDKGDGKFSFVMPDSKVDVKATFVKSEVKPDQPSKTAFVDVPENSWYADAADFVAQRGLMSGVGENLFGGGQNTTRAMLMTILARMDGQDVTGGATWYEKAMNWAKQTGVSDGTMPEVNITREQLATMLYSYAKLKGVDTTQGGMAVREFNDYDSISAWANQSMAWAVNAGILSGRGNNTLAPTAGATRAEMAVMLQQFVGLMEK